MSGLASSGRDRPTSNSWPLTFWPLSAAGAPCWAPVTLLRACLIRPSRSPVLTVLAPSHITVALRKFAAGSGRRKNRQRKQDPPGWADRRLVSARARRRLGRGGHRVA